MEYKDESINLNKKIGKNLKYTLRLVLICVISTMLSIALNNVGIGKENTLMVFLVGVLTVTAVTRGYAYGVVASVLSVLMFNYFFTHPLHSLAISYSKDVVLLAFFLIASLISSTMTSKFQYQTAIAKHNERTARLLYEITKGFLNVTGIDNIVMKGINYISDYLGYQCRVKLNSEDKIFTTPGFSEGEGFERKAVYKVPIKGVANQIGIMEIIDAEVPISAENDMLIKTIVYQMALVLDREFIYNEREKIRVSMEGERLKSTLLRSISHDLRTPLTGMRGASELILEGFDTMDPKTVRSLVSDINEESKWLIKAIQNILDMTRISEGKLTVNRDYEAVDDLINQALTLLPQLTSSGKLNVSAPEDIILISVDGRLMVQALVNLLDNAYKHSGRNSEISLRAYRENKNIIFEVADNGAGIDPTIQDTLFDGFVTLHRNIADGGRGVGLGLAICKAIVNAHNGSITAENQETGGAIFKIVLPTEEV